MEFKLLSVMAKMMMSTMVVVLWRYQIFTMQDGSFFDMTPIDGVYVGETGVLFLLHNKRTKRQTNISIASERKSEFDLCDLDNQGHDHKMNRLFQGPMGSYIPSFKL